MALRDPRYKSDNSIIYAAKIRSEHEEITGAVRDIVRPSEREPLRITAILGDEYSSRVTR